jgi:polyisoprenoid-binding protein YceI
METVKWILDPSHSQVQFKVRHLVSQVSGYFDEFTTRVETEGDDFTTAKIDFTANANSINTNNDLRDQHLKGKDFLYTEKYPKIIFKGEKLKKKEDGNFLLHGVLTIRDVSRPVVLNVEYGGQEKDPWGNYRAGFIVQGKINRKDFGINFNMVTEAGGILVGDEVAIECNVEFIKQVENQTSATAKQKDLQAV